MWRPSSTSVIRRMTSYFPARIRENSMLLCLSSSSAIHEASAASPSLSPDHMTESCVQDFCEGWVKLVVHSISYDFVKGATVDYVEDLIRSAFQVTNHKLECSGREK